nr:MAG TPA: hypothetical protein [Caudoviricetes sp.]
MVKCRKILPRYPFLFNGRQRNHYIPQSTICKYIDTILLNVIKLYKKTGIEPVPHLFRWTA